MNSEVTEISLPSVVGWEWTSTYPDFPTTKHEIVWVRGTSGVTYNVKSGDRKWTGTSIVRPERLGFDGTLKGCRVLVDEFVNGGN